MPFKSEKQRRYMHANLPKIAQRWEKKYTKGGRIKVNSILNEGSSFVLQFPVRG